MTTRNLRLHGAPLRIAVDDTVIAMPQRKGIRPRRRNHPIRRGSRVLAEEASIHRAAGPQQQRKSKIESAAGIHPFSASTLRWCRRPGARTPCSRGYRVHGRIPGGFVPRPSGDGPEQSESDEVSAVQNRRAAHSGSAGTGRSSRFAVHGLSITGTPNTSSRCRNVSSHAAGSAPKRGASGCSDGRASP